MSIKSFLDLEVYQLAHKFAMKIFEMTKRFPVEEKIFIDRPDTAFITIDCRKYR